MNRQVLDCASPLALARRVGPSYKRTKKERSGIPAGSLQPTQENRAVSYPDTTLSQHNRHCAYMSSVGRVRANHGSRLTALLSKQFSHLALHECLASGFAGEKGTHAAHSSTVKQFKEVRSSFTGGCNETKKERGRPAPASLERVCQEGPKEVSSGPGWPMRSIVHITHSAMAARHRRFLLLLGDFSHEAFRGEQ